MKRKNLIMAISIILLLSVVFSFMLMKKKLPTKTCFKEDLCIELEIASTPEEQMRGLMFRESLEENQGMLFIYDSENMKKFWMKNTLIPLDMIWVNNDLKIVHIEHAVPCIEEECISYTPIAEAKYVIEVNKGFTEKNNININDSIQIL